jgi:hypothetical protein
MFRSMVCSLSNQRLLWSRLNWSRSANKDPNTAFRA